MSRKSAAAKRSKLTIVQRMAKFIDLAAFDWMSDEAVERLKICVLDALGSAIRAIGEGPTAAIRRHTEEFGGAKNCTLIGGGRSAPDRAAFYNSSLVRYIDFNDSYLGEHGTCHPSDNFGAVLAACEFTDRSGKDLLTALAIAYQIQCRLVESTPIMSKGFDHSTFLAYSLAGGIAKALRLDRERIAHSLALAGDSCLTLTVTRSHPMSNWKGLAAPQAAFGCMQTAFLARQGITGPLHVFEGPKGLIEATGEKINVDWEKEDLEAAKRTTLKRFNAEVHAQSLLEATLELRNEHGIKATRIESVDVEVFQVAYDIVGGGEWGDRKAVPIKEEADHSIPYMVAAALLDGDVQPEQYDPKRIVRSDIQRLLQKVTVTPRHGYTSRYPREVRCRVTIRLQDGSEFAKEKKDFHGFVSRPHTWEDAVAKFNQLSESTTSVAARRRLVAAIRSLETHSAREIARLLAKVGDQRRGLQATRSAARTRKRHPAVS